MKRKIASIVAAAGLLVTLGACNKNVDVEAAGALPVPGVTGLFYFCHGPTLVYFTQWDGTDEYEAMWPGWCVQMPDGKWVYPVNDPKLFPAASSTDENVQEDGE